MPAHLVHKRLVGAYVYAIIVGGTVRYIGKGRRYRALEHFRYARELNRRRENGERIKALPFHNRLAKAMRGGVKVSYKIIASGMSDADAYAAEAREIAAMPDGQLWNIKPGGTGNDGSVMRRMWGDLVFRANVLAGQEAVRSDPEFRQRQREISVSRWNDGEFRGRWMAQHRALWDDPARAAERRALLKKVWADPEKSAKKSALVKSQWTPERKAAMAENRRRAWADPEFKRRVTEKIRQSKRRADGRPG